MYSIRFYVIIISMNMGPGETLTEANGTSNEIKRRLSRLHDAEIVKELEPIIELTVAAHEGHDGLDGKPLALHCADVTCSSDLSTLEQRQLGLL